MPRTWDILSPWMLILLTPLLGSARRATVKLTNYPGRAGCPGTTTLPTSRSPWLGVCLCLALSSALFLLISFKPHTNLCSQPSGFHNFTDKRNPRPGDMKSCDHDGTFRKQQIQDENPDSCAQPMLLISQL